MAVGARRKKDFETDKMQGRRILNNIRTSDAEADIIFDAATERRQSMQRWMRTRLLVAAKIESQPVEGNQRYWAELQLLQEKEIG